MKSIIIGIAILGAAFVVPAAASAATYQYVNVQGMVMTVSASSDVEALATPGIASNSGVILVQDEKIPSTTQVSL